MHSTRRHFLQSALSGGLVAAAAVPALAKDKSRASLEQLNRAAQRFEALLPPGPPPGSGTSAGRGPSPGSG